MKMFYGSTPIKSMKTHIFDIDSSDATMVASDLQAGVTAYARGRKVIGTGKTFSFAMYGGCNSNQILPIPVGDINTILISSVSYQTKMIKSILELQKMDFSTPKEVAVVTIDETDYPITIKAINNMITIACSQTITLQVLFGKDEHIS